MTDGYLYLFGAISRFLGHSESCQISKDDIIHKEASPRNKWVTLQKFPLDSQFF